VGAGSLAVSGSVFAVAPATLLARGTLKSTPRSEAPHPQRSACAAFSRSHTGQTRTND
jgi:hypothetical protein